jgi:hypothetical protein
VSTLPERRKSPAELAELRAGLGMSDGADPAAPARLPEPTQLPPLPTPSPATTSGASSATTAAARSAAVPADPAMPTDPPASSGPKPVRSLKRSERAPIERPARPVQPPAGKLPVQRRTDQEIERLRTRNAMGVQAPVARLAAQAAHPVVLGLGYVLALAGGAGGLLVAAFLFARKPRSHCHAAFITIIAVLVLAFGILYLLSQRDAA